MALKVLTIDVGGTFVKMLASNETERRVFESGPGLTPGRMAARVKKLARGWSYDVVSIGYPGPVRNNRPVAEPRNLGKGWMRFNFEAAFKCPVTIINDAAMQALGSYRGGTMLFLGLGTGLGAALMVRGHIVPLELGNLSYKRGVVEDYLGARGLQRLGPKKWQQHVETYVDRIIPALQVEDVVLGGGNVKKLEKLPRGCRAGDNDHAFTGGFLLWKSFKQRSRLQRPAAVQQPKKRSAGKS